MPDLRAQLRDYARFAVDAVEPVRADEVAERTPGPGVRRFPVRAVAAGVAVAAVIGAVVSWPRDERRAVRVAVEPPPATVPTTTVVPLQPPTPSFSALARAAGIAGVRRDGSEETAIKVVALDGTAFWVVLPDDVPAVPDLQIVATAGVAARGAVSPRSYVTSLAGPAVAAGWCRDDPSGQCREAGVLAQRVLGNGAVFTHWALPLSEPFITVELGSWTLVLEGGSAAGNERIATALVWAVDRDGYLRLRSADPEVDVLLAPVQLSANVTGDPADGIRIIVQDGCGPSGPGGPISGDLARFTIGPPRRDASALIAYIGRWCAAGTHRVEVTTGDAAVVERLYERLRIEPAR